MLSSLLLVISASIASANIDFSNIPGCARNACFPFHSSSIGCAQFTKDCFCNQALAPINYASQSCIGQDWFGLEDWFDKICPSPQLVDFSTLPACSRACIRDAIIPAWCPVFNSPTPSAPTITRNCFCRLNETFTTLTTCLTQGCLMNQTQAAERLHQEYTGGCFYSPGYEPDSGGTSNQDQVVSAPARGGSRELSMKTLSAIMGPIASIFVIISGVWGFFKCWRKKDKRTVHFHGDLQGATFNVSSKGVDLPPAYSR